MRVYDKIYSQTAQSFAFDDGRPTTLNFRTDSALGDVHVADFVGAVVCSIYSGEAS